VILDIDGTLPPEAFCIEGTDSGVCVAGGALQGLLYGVGKFLRTSSYAGAFEPSSWRGTSVPRGAMRGIYFASHFHNWYQMAPDDQVERYIEDLALWGVNAMMLCFPFINLRGWDDPEAEQAVEVVSRYGRMARELGLRFGLVRSNSLFSGAPDEARAVPVVDTVGRRGNHGNPICPSSAQGRAYILDSMRELFERLRPVGLDFLTFWPYDEGGFGFSTFVCIRLVLSAFNKRLADDQADAPALVSNGTVKHIVRCVRRVPDKRDLVGVRAVQAGWVPARLVERIGVHNPVVEIV
jgi:hypothetical protein